MVVGTQEPNRDKKEGHENMEVGTQEPLDMLTD